MKIKTFLSYDEMYRKKVNAVNIILSPKEYELLKKGLVCCGDYIETGERLKKFLRRYEPYKPAGEDKEFPDGAYNTVIFEDMYLEAFGDLINCLCMIGSLNNLNCASEKLIETQKGIINDYRALINGFKMANSGE